MEFLEVAAELQLSHPHLANGVRFKPPTAKYPASASSKVVRPTQSHCTHLAGSNCICRSLSRGSYLGALHGLIYTVEVSTLLIHLQGQSKWLCHLAWQYGR